VVKKTLAVPVRECDSQQVPVGQDADPRGQRHAEQREQGRDVTDQHHQPGRNTVDPRAGREPNDQPRQPGRGGQPPDLHGAGLHRHDGDERESDPGSVGANRAGRLA